MNERVSFLAACSLLCACGSGIDRQPEQVETVHDAHRINTPNASTAQSAEDIPYVRCEVDESVQRLTRAELEAIRSGNWTFNSLVAELAERMPPKEPPNLPDTINEKEVDWEQAKRMVWNALVTTTIQAHDRTVILITTSGRSYRTVEPRLDDIWRVAAE